MAGHLFISKCDLTKLACDAWLLPTNAQKQVQPYWFNACLDNLGVPHGDFSQFAVPSEFGLEKKTALPKALPETLEYPTPILTITGSDKDQNTDWYIDSVNQFLETFKKIEKRYLSFRIRPLAAIPLVGTGQGGAAPNVSDLIKSILINCHKQAQKLDIDIVLSMKDSFHYSACQMERKRLDKELNFWPELSATHKQAGATIAEHAKKGQLVLFLGAGVSAGAGLPSWEKLLARLTEKIDFSKSQQKALNQFDFLDQAEILKKEFAKHNIDMNHEIVDILANKSIYSLAHTLISDWPTNEIVTQNYDNMFEMACGDGSHPLSVIPYTFAEDSPKWLLKMHGCVTRPEDIVLTRSDYLDYDYNRSALSGIVQALLITKHMLFLGFSLTDDHFIQLIFGVHKAIKSMLDGQAPHKFGTVLTPVQSALQEELWTNELNFISSDITDDHFLKSLNWHDIFLDYITSLSHTSHKYLFNRKYESLLSEQEVSLRDSLQAVHEKVKSKGSSEMVYEFEEYLKTLGMEA